MHTTFNAYPTQPRSLAEECFKDKLYMQLFRHVFRIVTIAKMKSMNGATAKNTVEPLYNGHHWDQGFCPL